MRRVLEILRRLLGPTSRVLHDVFVQVVPKVIAEVYRAGAKSDAEIRAIAQREVKEYITARWPAYLFLTDKAVDAVFEFVRERLRGRIN